MEPELKYLEVYDCKIKKENYKVIYLGEDTKFKTKHLVAFSTGLSRFIYLLCFKDYTLENSKLKIKGYKRIPNLSKLEREYLDSLLQKKDL